MNEMNSIIIGEIWMDDEKYMKMDKKWWERRGKRVSKVARSKEENVQGSLSRMATLGTMAPCHGSSGHDRGLENKFPKVQVVPHGYGPAPNLSKIEKTIVNKLSYECGHSPQ